MRRDRTWKALEPGRKAPGEHVREFVLPAGARGFNASVPRNLLTPGEVVKARLEYSTDGKATWNLICGFSTTGGTVLSRDGSVAVESGISIALLDTVHFKLPGTDGEEDWYEVRSRSLPAGTDLRMTVRLASASNVECDAHLEEGPAEVKRREKLHHSVAFDAASEVSFTTVTSATWAHTCTGTDRGLTVGVAEYLDSGAITATYNAVSMTQEDSQATPFGANDRAILYSLIAPATGTHDIVVTFTTQVNGGAGGTSVTGANQTDLMGTPAKASDTSTAPSVAVTSATDELVVDVLKVYSVAPTAGAGQTQRWAGGSTTNERGRGSTEPGAASVTMSWSLDGSSDWAIVAASIKPAAAAAVVIPKPSIIQNAVHRAASW